MTSEQVSNACARVSPLESKSAASLFDCSDVGIGVGAGAGVGIGVGVGADIERVPLDIRQQLANVLECPVCFDCVLPPILQCCSGHLVCAACRAKLSCCPTCRGPLANIRNLAMEKLAKTLTYRCKHASHGCPQVLSYRAKQAHEDACEFRPYNCPFAHEACSWEGSVDQVYAHLLKAHSYTARMSGADIVFLCTSIALNGPLNWAMIQSCHEQHFLLTLQRINAHSVNVNDDDDCDHYVISCQLIGTQSQIRRATLVATSRAQRLPTRIQPHRRVHRCHRHRAVMVASPPI